jgi:hypothetical protein
MADTVFPANDDWLARDALRTWLKQARRGNAVLSGFFITDGGGLNASASAGTAVVDGVYIDRTSATTLALTASSTNHVFLTVDESALDTVVFTVNTTGTAPATPYLKIATVVTGVSTINADGITNIRPQSSEVYDRVNTEGQTVTGDLLGEGYCTLINTISQGDASAYVNGPAGFWSSKTYDGAAVGALYTLVFPQPFVGIHGLFTNTQSDVYALGCRGRGFKFFIKGRYKALSDTPIDGAYERFAVGVCLGGGSIATLGTGLQVLANETEGTRDDIATVAVVVDDSENIQSYNCADAGDAAYTDSTYDADLSEGTDFELIVEVPSAANSDDDLRVTIKIRDNGGTMRTVLNAVAPVSTATSHTVLFPIFRCNQDAVLERVCYKVEKAA